MNTATTTLIVLLLQVEDGQEDPNVYDPFQYMLQFALDPLLVPSAGTDAGATHNIIIKTFQSLKRTEDTAVGSGFNIHQNALRAVYIML